MSVFAGRLRKMRQQAGLTQEDLAQRLQISRATYIKIESGQRSPTVAELDCLARIFEVTVGGLVDPGPAAVYRPPQKVIVAAKRGAGQRSPSGAVNISKLEAVLLYVICRVGSRPNVGETVIYKLLYFIDFDYFEKHDRSITGLRYIHNHYGPTPGQVFSDLITEMEAAGKVQKQLVAFHGKKQTKYIACVEPDTEVLSGREVDHINDVLDRLSSKTAQQITEYAHQDVPWAATEPGEAIDYHLSKYRTGATSVATNDEETDPL